MIWRRNSPAWAFDDATLDRAAESFDNPDYVDVVIHSYRHRLGHAAGAPAYGRPEVGLAALPPVGVPAVTLDGTRRRQLPGHGCLRERRPLHRPPRAPPGSGAGHNLPQEAPEAFAAAVHEVAELAAREDRA